MAPFDNEYSSDLTNKLSPLIEGQVADFVRDDHPVFTRFLKHYYQYLEAARIIYSGELDYLRLQTNTLEFVLQEDGERIVTEAGAGTTFTLAGDSGDNQSISQRVILRGLHLQKRNFFQAK